MNPSSASQPGGILIITQKVDRQDDGLGFFHRWLEKFAQIFPRIQVICLQKGETVLPTNVQIRSLGKEGGRSRIKYIVNFYRFVFSHWSDYGSVLVHMNPVYVILGGVFWRLGGKKIILWYNHPRGNWQAKLAYRLAHAVCYTSNKSFFSKSAKAHQMPAGIDTEVFRRNEAIVRPVHSVLCLGRIAPIKFTHTIIEAANLLLAQNVDFHLGVVGGPAEGDDEYFEKIKKLAASLIRVGRVTFHPPVSNWQTPQIYNHYEIYVNATPSGSLDKTIPEAMACECLALSSNLSFDQILPPEFIFEQANSSDLAAKLKAMLALAGDRRETLGQEMRRLAIEYHDLDALIKKLKIIIESR